MSRDDRVRIGFRRLDHGRDLPPPRNASDASAGWDLRAAVDAPVVLDPGARVRIPTAVALEIPHGWEGQVRPRSGLAHRHGVTVLNGPGTIDADYRGEVCVLLVNLGTRPFLLERGDRIAQIVFSKVAVVEWEEREELDATRRGAGGFGSTGKR